MNEPLVILQNLSKRFLPQGPAVLDQIDVVIPRGQIVGLAGPDGAGKTTLLRLIAGLLVPTEGKISVNGIDSLENPSAIHQFTGYMPQRFGLYEDLTVEQNLDLYAELRGVPKIEKTDLFEQLLEFTKLQPFTRRLAGALSGGMKQKLGLACALMTKPLLLLLDEPTVGVDPISRKELWKMVSSLVDEGISVVWSTAYLNEVERCATTLLLNQGKLLYKGPPQALTERVKNRVYRVSSIEGNRRKLLFEFLKSSNIIDGVIQGKDLRLVTRTPETPQLPSSDATFQIDLEAPRFEDGFIDILGGGPGGSSKLAASRSLVPQNTDTPVQAQSLTKKFGNFTAASAICFEIRRGEIFGLLGPNGAGKSTTFKMLCGLLQPTEGKALVNGLNLATAPGPAKLQIGYMAQKFSLYGSLSVLQNLSFFAGIYDLSGSKKAEAIQKMAEVFELTPFLSDTAETLPLGYKQRLSLACANLHQPPLIFLDEPTSGVDPITRREFWNHINGLVEKGVTVMVTTHFMDEAEYCDRIALIYRGQVIHMDTPDALKASAMTQENPTPTLEDAFIHLIETHDAQNPSIL